MKIWLLQSSSHFRNSRWRSINVLTIILRQGFRLGCLNYEQLAKMPRSLLCKHIPEQKKFVKSLANCNSVFCPQKYFQEFFFFLFLVCFDKRFEHLLLVLRPTLLRLLDGSTSFSRKHLADTSFNRPKHFGRQNVCRPNVFRPKEVESSKLK